jgi:zinc transporter ZupT
LLGFAAGSLLADVFLHLIPELFHNVNELEAGQNGMRVISSFMIFLIIEKTTGLIPGAHALGVLNLLANFFDNMAHGTTVVGAFQNSAKFGLVALLATIIHEIPHEFSDFALLLRDGYSRQTAILAQVCLYSDLIYEKLLIELLVDIEKTNIDKLLVKWQIKIFRQNGI